MEENFQDLDEHRCDLIKMRDGLKDLKFPLRQTLYTSVMRGN